MVSLVNKGEETGERRKSVGEKMTRGGGGVGSKKEALAVMTLAQFQFLAIFTGGGGVKRSRTN